MESYDLFLFDLDGTLVNTEHLHYNAYQLAFKYYNIPVDLTFMDYCKYTHFDDTSLRKYIVQYTDISFDLIYNKKKSLFIDSLDTNLQFIEGADTTLDKLIKTGTKTCIVTHSDRDVLDKIITILPLLNKVDKIITKNDYINRKPHPECYLKALNIFSSCTNPIGFEDSYKGYMSLTKTNITPVFIGDSSYYYFKNISPAYPFTNFKTIDWSKISPISNNYINYTGACIDKYTDSLNSCRNNFNTIVSHVLPIIKNCTRNVYLTGIGKCGHVAKKCVSTWQSVGISCHYINIPDLFHGDFGILQDTDVIIYISNSGNTDELINCCNYIHANFNVLQICLTIKNNTKITQYVDFHYCLTQSNITEIDSINMAPTTSSLLFMALLDMIGVKLGEEKGLTIEKFKRTHPGGDLGKISNNIIDYVVIVASGLGSRLHPMTQYIPKILVTFNNKPFIDHLIGYWQKYCKKIIIIINSQYNEIVKFYTQNYMSVTILNFNNATGTADTIYNTIHKQYYNKNILFTWCDILPNINLDISRLIGNVVFTYGNECKYNAEDGIIRKLDSSSGNVIGIYYIKQYSGINKYTIGDDICDIYINNFSNFTTYNIDSLIDIGDITKFRKYSCVNQFQTRFFNTITLTPNNTLVKSSINEQGNDIITKEMNWYKKLSCDISPKIFKYFTNSFEMEYINAKPLFHCFDSFDINKQLAIINDITNVLNKLHSSSLLVSNNTLESDLHIECYSKVTSRLSKIKQVIDFFNTPNKITSVNNLPICDVNTVLNNCYNIIKSNVSNNYKFIHGDCQFSNIMYNINNNKIYFIDPRGYFGNTLLYGIPEYDFAKILYALTGYDSFNNNNEYTITGISNNNINIDIKSYDHLFDLLPTKIFNKTTIALTVVIWIALAQYNSNNLLKCISSYYNGLYIYSKYLEKFDI